MVQIRKATLELSYTFAEPGVGRVPCLLLSSLPGGHGTSETLKQQNQKKSKTETLRKAMLVPSQPQSGARGWQRWPGCSRGLQWCNSGKHAKEAVRVSHSFSNCRNFNAIGNGAIGNAMVGMQWCKWESAGATLSATAGTSMPLAMAQLGMQWWECSGASGRA
eukprot:1158072-Pelagomonas_calceolata.AAC.3